MAVHVTVDVVHLCCLLPPYRLGAPPSPLSLKELIGLITGCQLSVAYWCCLCELFHQLDNACKKNT